MDIAAKTTKNKPKLNRRQRTIISTIFAAILLIAIVLGGLLINNEKIGTSLETRNLPPSLQHPFGTDWLGRDMLARTIKGLTLSLGVGMLASVVSVFIALTLGMSAATMGKRVDELVSWLVDLFLSVPHIVTLILIAFCLGGGKKV